MKSVVIFLAIAYLFCNFAVYGNAQGSFDDDEIIYAESVSQPAKQSGLPKVLKAAIDLFHLSPTSFDIDAYLLNADLSDPVQFFTDLEVPAINPKATKPFLYLLEIFSKSPLDLITKVAIPLLNSETLKPVLYLLRQTALNPISAIENVLVPILKRSTALTIVNVLQILQRFPKITVGVLVPLVLNPATNSLIRIILTNIFKGPFAISKPINYFLEKAITDRDNFISQLVLPILQASTVTHVSFLIEQPSSNLISYIINIILPSYNPINLKPTTFFFEQGVENPKELVTGLILPLLNRDTANAIESFIKDLQSDPFLILSDLVFPIFTLPVLIFQALQ